MQGYVGVLLGSFNGFHDVVMDRSCIISKTREDALKNAQTMQEIHADEDAATWLPEVEELS